MCIESYTYNGFTYCLNSYDKPVSVIHNKVKPESIYKFYAMNEHNIYALINNYFYASHPNDLNDILDSSHGILFTSKKLNFEFYKQVFGEDNLKKLFSYYEKDSANNSINYFQRYWELATNLFGIISTTENENDSLMWPHYTQEKGFQLKFNTLRLEKSINNNMISGEYLGLLPINYTGRLECIDISKFKTSHIPLYYATNVKNIIWNHENEWRFLVSRPNMGVPNSKLGFNPNEDYKGHIENRFIYYDKNIIEEIVLGFNFFNAGNFHIKWLNSNNIEVKIKEDIVELDYKNLFNLLNYVVKNLSDRLFISKVLGKLDKKGTQTLIRKKEKLEINIIDEKTFIIIKTNIIS